MLALYNAQGGAQRGSTQTFAQTFAQIFILINVNEKNIRPDIFYNFVSETKITNTQIYKSAEPNRNANKEINDAKKVYITPKVYSIQIPDFCAGPKPNASDTVIDPRAKQNPFTDLNFEETDNATDAGATDADGTSATASSPWGD